MRLPELIFLFLLPAVVTLSLRNISWRCEKMQLSVTSDILILKLTSPGSITTARKTPSNHRLGKYTEYVFSELAFLQSTPSIFSYIRTFLRPLPENQSMLTWFCHCMNYKIPYHMKFSVFARDEIFAGFRQNMSRSRELFGNTCKRHHVF